MYQTISLSRFSLSQHMEQLSETKQDKHMKIMNIKVDLQQSNQEALVKSILICQKSAQMILLDVPFLILTMPYLYKMSLSKKDRHIDSKNLQKTNWFLG